MKNYLKLGVLNKNIGELGVFIAESEREAVWNEEVVLTLVLRNYSNITIQELIIENFWSEWGSLVKGKVKSNNKVITIDENENIVVNNMNQQEICIVEFKFNIKEKSPMYIKRRVKTYFKYCNEELNKEYHKIDGDYVRFKIYEKLIENVEIKKEILIKAQMHPIYKPLNYDVKFNINNIKTSESNKEKIKSKIEGNVFINIYYESDSGKFDNLQELIIFCKNINDINPKIEELHISTQKLLIKIIDNKKIFTTINFNIYKAYMSSKNNYFED